MMRLPVEWLKEYVDIKTKVSNIADDLTLLGHEVEEILSGDILNCDITPNRGDCLSIIGLARELAAAKNLKINLDKFKTGPRYELKTEFPDIQFEDKKLCPLYSFLVLENFEIGESPYWMQQRLKAFNLKPINNIVDITNYVMLETGQPLHAFDLDKISGNKMLIRKAKKGEQMTTLDEKTIKLSPEALIIQDSEKIIDLAGIMGGQASEVDHNTKKILLQAAIFAPAAIRNSSKTLQKSTEASLRYERGVDLENSRTYLIYAARLYQELTKAKLSEIQTIANQKIKKPTIVYSHSQINKLLGTNLPKKQISGILERLGFKVENNTAAVPGYRAFDVTIWQDLAEEVARIYGYNKLPKLTLKPKKVERHNQIYFAIERIKDSLSELHYTQSESYSFVSSKDLDGIKFDKKRCLKIINPVSELNEFLRPNLKIGLLKTIANNPFVPVQKVFEIGKIFSKDRENYHLAIASTLANTKLLNSELKSFSKSLDLKLKNSFEAIPKDILSSFKIKRPVFYTEIDLEKILNRIDITTYHPKLLKKTTFKQYPKLPPVTRDLSFIVDKKTNPLKISEAISRINTKIYSIISVTLFDEFVSVKFGKDKKSIAFHILIQPQKQTLKDSQIIEITDRIIKEVGKKFNAKLRG